MAAFPSCNKRLQSMLRVKVTGHHHCVEAEGMRNNQTTGLFQVRDQRSVQIVSHNEDKLNQLLLVYNTVLC